MRAIPNFIAVFFDKRRAPTLPAVLLEGPSDERRVLLRFDWCLLIPCHLWVAFSAAQAFLNFYQDCSPTSGTRRWRLWSLSL